MRKRKAQSVCNGILYRNLARYYDLAFSYKDYPKEVAFIDRIRKSVNSKGKSVLDVACGTGNHAKLLSRKGYEVVGVDKNVEVLSIARKKIPRATFVRGDMRTFKVEKRFDIVICMFTSINYMTNMNDLIRTLRNFREHMKDNGCIIFDFPRRWKPGISAKFLLSNRAVIVHEAKELQKKVRIATYLVVKRGENVEVIKDVNEIRIYSLRELSEAIKRVGLRSKTYWDFSLTKGQGGRPIIVCQKSKSSFRS